MNQIDTYSREYLLDCYARWLIREIRQFATPQAREKQLEHRLRKQQPAFRRAMRDRVRRLWKETNKADGWDASQRKRYRGEHHGNTAKGR